MKKAALQQSEERKITGTGQYDIDSSLISAKVGGVTGDKEIYEEDFEDEDNYSDDFDND